MNANKLKIVFAGTPAFGLPALEALFHSGHEIIAVYSQPDRPAGRGKKYQASPVKQWAIDHGILVCQPENFRSDEALASLRALNADLMVVIAYGLLLPQAVLDIPKYGCINVHASILPAWRGASPIQSAILHGDTTSGVSIMQMDKGMDTGPILSIETLFIHQKETAGSLHDRLAELSRVPLLKVVDDIALERVTKIPQDDAKASYAHKIQKEDAQIRWKKTASEIDRMIRAYDPWPVAFTLTNTQRIRVFDAQIEAGDTRRGVPGEILSIDATGILVATGDVPLRILKIQFPGGRVLAVSEWIHARSPLLVEGQLFHS